MITTIPVIDPMPTSIVWGCIMEKGSAFGDIRSAIAKVPGGWLVKVAGYNQVGTFIPDPKHEWKTEPCK